MKVLNDFTKNLYHMPIAIRIPSLAICFVMFFIIQAQVELVKTTRPLLVIVSLYFLMLLITQLAKTTTSLVTRKINIKYPTTALWIYPTISFGLIISISFLMLKLGTLLSGRGFWSSFLHLTAKDTTRFFSTTFMAMVVFIAFQFIYAVTICVDWFIKKSKSHISTVSSSISDGIKNDSLENTFSTIKKENEEIKDARIMASNFNRKSFVFLVFILLLAGYSFTIYNPALILYYRAEIQLKTFQNHELAHKTLGHLLDKYPDYKYRDTVEFRMAWILDRRLKKYKEALNEYLSFVKKYDKQSPWLDEATANIIRIYADKLNKPNETIKWANIFRTQFPDSIFSPQIAIYLIRAYRGVNKANEANKIMASSIKLFGDNLMQVINSEDHIVERISFKDALGI